ncbi:hypothetical protein ABLE94_02915 [Gordonia sp. VNK1]|uniref:hypothetical protein n=1 Tax=Gordonia oleivorans TaxID=3156618 RepID=UPI0032B36FA8
MNNSGSNNTDPCDSSGPQRITDRERATQAVHLRTHGHTLDDIAERLGYYDRAAVYRAITRSLDRVETENATQYRELMTDRYEGLLRRAMDALDDADEGREVGRAQLLSAARGICDSLVRLHGLDNAPVVTIRSETQLDRDIACLTEMVAAIDAQPEQPQLPAPEGDNR